MNPALTVLDRIEHITSCLEAVSDLMLPETDLHAVDRDKFGLLMTFLITEQRLAIAQLSQAKMLPR